MNLLVPHCLCVVWTTVHCELKCWQRAFRHHLPSSLQRLHHHHHLQHLIPQCLPSRYLYISIRYVSCLDVHTTLLQRSLQLDWSSISSEGPWQNIVSEGTTFLLENLPPGRVVHVRAAVTQFTTGTAEATRRMSDVLAIRFVSCRLSCFLLIIVSLV